MQELPSVTESSSSTRFPCHQDCAADAEAARSTLAGFDYNPCTVSYCAGALFVKLHPMALSSLMTATAVSWDTVSEYH